MALTDGEDSEEMVDAMDVTDGPGDATAGAMDADDDVVTAAAAIGVLGTIFCGRQLVNCRFLMAPAPRRRSCRQAVLPSVP